MFMPIDAVKRPMTLPAKTCTVFNEKSLIRVRRPRIFVMSREFAANFFAFFARIVSVFHNRISPIFVFSPLAAALYGSRIISFKIPMTFASHNAVANISALLPTNFGTAVRFIVNNRCANFARKCFVPRPFIVRCSIKVGYSVFLNLLRSTFYSFVPKCWHAFTKVFRAKSGDTSLLKPIPNRPSVNSKALANSFRAEFLNDVKCVQFNVVRCHIPYIAQKHAVKNTLCVATDTWKRAALSTW